MRTPRNDSNDLQRFVDAQNPIFDAVCEELRAGYKRTHWMWFIFPQLRELGRSPTAQHYGISGLAEATVYVQHPLLGPRLRDCTKLVTEVEGRSVAQIFGSPDDLKFRSCMTLFAHATADNRIFVEALTLFYPDQEDRLTVEILNAARPAQ
jgi:uncharacterized protein (DUF1810 family)